MNNRSNSVAILWFCLFIWVAVPVYGQTPDPQYPSDEDKVHSDVLDVVESAFHDLSFLLSLQTKVTDNKPLLQQLQTDYYPLFDQTAIARLTVGRKFNKFNQVHRDYLSCLIGLRFFNNHLNIVNTKAESNIQFQIGDLSISGTSKIVDIDVSYVNGTVTIPMVVRLTQRGNKSNWQIFDAVTNGISILSVLKVEFIEANQQAVDNGSPEFNRIKHVLNEKNRLGPIASEQWCKLGDNPAEPKHTSAKTESNEVLEIKTTLNGKSENIYVEVTQTGTVIYQDDIILDTSGDLEAAVSNLDFSKLRLWDNAVVPYIIDKSISQKQRTSILDAIIEFEKKTPVRFTEAGGSDENILMFRAGDGCRSSLGMIGGTQFILLGEHCSYGAVLHEIGQRKQLSSCDVDRVRQLYTPLLKKTQDRKPG